MDEMYDALLFPEDLTPEQRAALQQAMVDDPGLAEAVAQWRLVRKAVRDSLDQHVPDRRLLMLYALHAAGQDVALTEAEQQALEAVRPSLEHALLVHPALQDVIHDIQEAVQDFEAAWTEHTPPVPATSTRRPADHSPADRSLADRSLADRRPAARARATSAPSWRWGMRIGLGVAVVAFVAVLLLVVQRDQNMVTVQAAPGAIETITLADGSTVRLLGGATLVYADPEQAMAFSRHVRLTGQAYFDVVPENEGFTVETANALTRVLGTAFGVQADEQTTDVILAAGRVALASKAAEDQIVVLAPGQSSRVVTDALPTTPVEVELTDALLWTDQFVFRNTPLAVAASRLGEHYEVSVEIAEALASETVNGTFRHEEATLPEILETLARTLDASVHALPEGGYRVEDDPAS